MEPEPSQICTTSHLWSRYIARSRSRSRNLRRDTRAIFEHSKMRRKWQLTSNQTERSAYLGGMAAMILLDLFCRVTDAYLLSVSLNTIPSRQRTWSASAASQMKNRRELSGSANKPSPIRTRVCNKHTQRVTWYWSYW